jgi:hypothetical protein
LNRLGGNRFLAMLKKHQIQYNNGFLGVYNFNAHDTNSYRGLMLKVALYR